MLTLPNTLDDFLNKCISIHIIEYHELGHAKAICKVIKKNPNLSNVKPIILIGDYRTSLESTSAKSVFIDVNNIDKVDEDKHIIYFKPSKGHTKGHTKGITLHPDFAKMNDKELKLCLKAGYYREAKICLPICILLLLSALQINSLCPVFMSIAIITFFICLMLKSSDWLYAKNPISFRQAQDWTALYSSCEHLLKSDKHLYA